MDIFKDVNTLQKGLSASWTRNSVIMNNVANADTPDFKTSSVEFEDLYRQSLQSEKEGIALKKTRPTHMDIGTSSLEDVKPVVQVNEDTTARMDGNNVDIDKEMTDLAKNVIYYNALTRKISGEFTQLRLAITEGR